MNTLWEPTKIVSHSLLVLLNRYRMTKQTEVLGKRHVGRKLFTYVPSNWKVYPQELRPNDHFGFPSAVDGVNVWHICKAAASYDRGHGENNKTVAFCQRNVLSGHLWLGERPQMRSDTPCSNRTLHSLRARRFLAGLLRRREEGSMIVFNIDHTAFALTHERDK